MAWLIAIIVLCLIAAIIALVLHLLIRWYLIAIMLTGLLLPIVPTMLVGYQGQPTERQVFRDAILLACVSIIGMVVSAAVGAPIALRRRRRADAVRGFDVLTPRSDAAR